MGCSSPSLAMLAARLRTSRYVVVVPSVHCNEQRQRRWISNPSVRATTFQADVIGSRRNVEARCEFRRDEQTSTGGIFHRARVVSSVRTEHGIGRRDRQLGGRVSATVPDTRRNPEQTGNVCPRRNKTRSSHPPSDAGPCGSSHIRRTQHSGRSASFPSMRDCTRGT